VTSAFSRVSALEEQVQRVDHRASSKDEVLRRSSDLVRVYDALHEDVLELRRKLFDVGELSRVLLDNDEILTSTCSTEQDLNRTFGTPTSRQANGRLV
jgi:hypothetical protein